MRNTNLKIPESSEQSFIIVHIFIRKTFYLISFFLLWFKNKQRLVYLTERYNIKKFLKINFDSKKLKLYFHLLYLLLFDSPTYIV